MRGDPDGRGREHGLQRGAAAHDPRAHDADPRRLERVRPVGGYGAEHIGYLRLPRGRSGWRGPLRDRAVLDPEERPGADGGLGAVNGRPVRRGLAALHGVAQPLINNRGPVPLLPWGPGLGVVRSPSYDCRVPAYSNSSGRRGLSASSVVRGSMGRPVQRSRLSSSTRSAIQPRAVSWCASLAAVYAWSCRMSFTRRQVGQTSTVIRVGPSATWRRWAACSGERAYSSTARAWIWFSTSISRSSLAASSAAKTRWSSIPSVNEPLRLRAPAVTPCVHPSSSQSREAVAIRSTASRISSSKWFTRLPWAGARSSRGCCDRCTGRRRPACPSPRG